MTREEAEAICREKLGIRIGPRMSDYVAKHASSPQAGESFPVIGGDARTGVPARKELNVSVVNQRNE